MADTNDDVQKSYPYMTANQWWGLRARFKSTVPKGPVTLDWIIGALDTTQKGAGNVLPQLRLLGLTDAQNKATDLVHDFKDDDTYAAATKQILESTYPDALRESYDDPGADAAKVAGWFSRNAKTGEQTSTHQARLYLLILGGQLPDPEAAKAPAKTPRAKKAPPTASVTTSETTTSAPARRDLGVVDGRKKEESRPSEPQLHIDLQIHIAADAGEAQIDAVFRSMAKHLYGR